MSLSVLPPSTTTRYSYSLTSKNTKSTISVTKVSPTVSKVSTTTPTDPVYPTFPDVSLKKLPFYKVEEVLLKPSTLQPMGKGKNVKSEHQNFSFHLTPAQISRINTTRFRSNKGLMENRHQIQLRFSLLDTTLNESDPVLALTVGGIIFLMYVLAEDFSVATEVRSLLSVSKMASNS